MSLSEAIRILILEDDLLVSMDLQAIVEETVPAIIVTERSLAAAERVLHEPLDFALLDIELTDGHTYEIARSLDRRQIPFVFVSAHPLDKMPEEFRAFTHIAKPYSAPQIARAVRSAYDRMKQKI